MALRANNVAEKDIPDRGHKVGKGKGRKCRKLEMVSVLEMVLVVVGAEVGKVGQNQMLMGLLGNLADGEIRKDLDGKCPVSNGIY